MLQATTILVSTLSLTAVVSVTSHNINLHNTSSLVILKGHAPLQDSDEDDGCAGCNATEHEDPATGLQNGAQVTYQALGWNVPEYTLDVFPASCAWTAGSDGVNVCGPEDNCKFRGNYHVRGPEEFHDDINGVNCRTSGPWIGGQEEIDDSTPQWLASCQDSVTSWNVRFLTGHDCLAGTVKVEIHFAGFCSKCEEVEGEPQ